MQKLTIIIELRDNEYIVDYNFICKNGKLSFDNDDYDHLFRYHKISHAIHPGGTCSTSIFIVLHI